jgi:Mrp family chromosome partitioning ATPase
MDATTGAAGTTAGQSGLADYAAMLRRSWAVIALAGLVGLFLAGLYFQAQPPQYTSVASVLVTPTGVQNAADLANGRTNSQINLDTEARLVRSSGVAREAQDLMNSGRSPDDLVASVAVSVPANTEVLAISYVAGTPSEAQQGAHAFAQAYLTSRGENAQKTLDQQMSTIKKQQDTTTRTLKTVAGTLVDLPNGSADRAYYSARKELLVQQLQGLQQVMGKLTTTVVTPGRLLNDAALPSAPSSPQPTMIFGSGLAAGLLAGLVIAIVRMRTNKRVHDAAEVERLFTVPVISEPRTLDHETLATRGSATSEAFRRVVNALPAPGPHQGVVVLVAGASPGQATGLVTANLAAAVARAGHTVTLLSGDPASDAATQVAGTPAEPGLSDALTGGGSVQSYGVTGVPGLRVVGPGMVTEDDRASLTSRDARRLIRVLSRRNRYLVIEAPPTSATADGQTLARHVDVIVMVIEKGVTTRAQVTDALNQFEEVGCAVAGTIVTPHVTVRRWYPRRPGIAVAPMPTEFAPPPETIQVASTDDLPESAGSAERDEPTGSHGIEIVHHDLVVDLIGPQRTAQQPQDDAETDEDAADERFLVAPPAVPNR